MKKIERATESASQNDNEQNSRVIIVRSRCSIIFHSDLIRISIRSRAFVIPAGEAVIKGR